MVARWGLAGGWLRGKAKLQDNFAIGVKAPGLHFELIDALLGVNAMCVVYRRESGMLASDLVEFNEHGRGERVFACCGQPTA